jgi:predicted lipoprotein with Yx(FWY)xxD motif
MHLLRMRFFLPCLLVAIGVAACGSSESSSSSSTTSAAAGSSSSTSSTASTPSTASTSAAAIAKAVVLTTKHDKKLGTILAAGNRKLTVYLFEADKGSTSHCTGACAVAWPPVTGKATVAGAARASELGTTMRAHGISQVTYKGHPLYFFAKDKDDGDAYGQNVHQFGADWYVLTPSGNKIDKS